MDLSDAWVVEIVRSNLTGRKRDEHYPLVFETKYLRKEYVNKGQAAKRYSSERKEWGYTVIFNSYQMFGWEGRSHGLSRDIDPKLTITSKNSLMESERCYIQSDKYNLHENAKPVKGK